MVLQKARSRLHPPANTPSTTSNSGNFSGVISFSRSTATHLKWLTTMITNSRILAIRQLVQPFLKRWPLVLIGSSVLFALWRLLATYTPVQLAHIIWPNSYLPVTSLWFIAQWYLGSFWLRHSKRGLLWAIIATTWLYTRLQLIIVAGWFWLCLLGSWLALELIWKNISRLRAR